MPEALLREAFWTRNTDHSLFSPQHCSLLPKVGCWTSQTQSWVHKRLLGCLRLPEVIPPIEVTVKLLCKSYLQNPRLQPLDDSLRAKNEGDAVIIYKDM